MSIELICNQAETDKLLFRVSTTLKAAKRRLYLTTEAVNDLSANGAITAMKLRPAVRARFEEWVIGEKILSEGSGKPGYLKQLDAPPIEIWEFRISAPTAKIRALGRFMHADSYIVTGLYSRDYLGNYGSQAWDQATQDCLSRWGKIFGKLPAFSGSIFSDYVTENCDEFRLGRLLSEGECALRRRSSKRRRSSRR